ncbi:mucin-associated surface protein (MASP) [Trypanosoma cruzi Dm28c]|uniref:Mucin-associated surface protein (MASP) n=1 Tax=Trypanosoma cruzi Dm28c TaxID=1416333 RepID=V5A5A7_TRYCR|nr:mucin-associated surface protein (MASP) [Trypanosoma cruzi Dm28c]
MGRCTLLCDSFFLLLSISVGVLLVCAEGCTQVTGVMAMMTGRVLLVCALCVLWCGVCGVYARNPDNNAVGGCMASGVLGENGFHMPSGCAKAVLALPLRSVLSVTAAGVPTSEEESQKNLSNPIDADGLQGSKGTISTLSMDAPETGVKSQSARPPAPAQTNLDGQEVSITNAETQSSIKQHAAGNQIVNRDEAGGEKERKAAVTGGTPSNQQPTPLQPVQQEQPTTDSHTRQKEERDSEEAQSPPPAPSPTNSTEGIPATRELQILTEEKNKRHRQKPKRSLWDKKNLQGMTQKIKTLRAQHHRIR